MPAPTETTPAAPATPVADKHYRIVALKIRNIKKIKAVEFTPVGDVITIGGKNGAGKSSLLDGIFYTLGGADAVCERPIREGQSEGESFLDLGEITVTKIWNAAGTTRLKLCMKDGTPISSPQTVLDKLCPKLIGDPMAFCREEKVKQNEILRKLVGLDFSALNAKRIQVYDARTLVNRDIATKKAQLAAKVKHEDAPAEEVSVKSLMAELSVLRAANRANDLVKDEAKKLMALVNSQRHDIAVAHQQIEEIQRQIAAKMHAKAAMEGDLTGLEISSNAKQTAVAALVYGDEEPITTRISEADTTNANVRANIERAKLATEIDGLESTEREHTKNLERIDKEKESLLANAKFPTDGLSFSESGVLLDKMPFSQANTARQIRASMDIAIAMNPKLRVVIIRNASLVDSEGRAEIARIAKEKDVQVWEELLTEDAEGDAKCSVVIVDGSIKE